MPAQTYKRTRGLKSKPPRQAVPLPGEGGYAYPRGPYGATGFPGSTPAARKTKGQGPDGRKDPSYRGRPRRTVQEQQWDWTGPEFDDPRTTEVPKPQPMVSERGPLRPGTQADPGNPFIREDGTPRQPRARQMRSTSAEHRMTPIIGAYTAGPKNLRNDYAQRWKADPLKWREYRPAPNPGKLGDHFDGKSQFHPDQQVYGHPDGVPIKGMPSQPGGPTVTVQSRFFSLEGAQEGYAMNRDMQFDHGGVAAFPPGYNGVRHIRGGRLTGQRYYGALADQQRIGLDSDSYGIKRRRGPNHRPVRFEQPAPWSTNYYDVPPEQGTQAPDMIHRTPSARRAPNRVRRG